MHTHKLRRMAYLSFGNTDRQKQCVKDLCDAGCLKNCVLLCPQLLLFERTWMNRWKSSVLHEGEGNIRSVKWRGHLIAWANNMVKTHVCL